MAWIRFFMWLGIVRVMAGLRWKEGYFMALGRLANAVLDLHKAAPDLDLSKLNKAVLELIEVSKKL